MPDCHLMTAPITATTLIIKTAGENDTKLVVEKMTYNISSDTKPFKKYEVLIYPMVSKNSTYNSSSYNKLTFTTPRGIYTNCTHNWKIKRGWFHLQVKLISHVMIGYRKSIYQKNTWSWNNRPQGMILRSVRETLTRTK